MLLNLHVTLQLTQVCHIFHHGNYTLMKAELALLYAFYKQNILRVSLKCHKASLCQNLEEKSHIMTSEPMFCLLSLRKVF